jgi:hypothetical protein
MVTPWLRDEAINGPTGDGHYNTEDVAHRKRCLCSLCDGSAVRFRPMVNVVIPLTDALLDERRPSYPPLRAPSQR